MAAEAISWLGERYRTVTATQLSLPVRERQAPPCVTGASPQVTEWFGEYDRAA
jgi:hypothetical protein